MVVSGRIPPDRVRADPGGPPGRTAAHPVQGSRAATRIPCEGTWLFTAPALDSSVPQVRHAVRDLLGQQAVPVASGTADGLLLILSELVTNAVKHAAVLSPQITVEIEVWAGWIKVAVGDDHPYRPRALETDHARTGGRGLVLVKAITAEAGGTYDVEHTPGGGKVVWAMLPLTP